MTILTWSLIATIVCSQHLVAVFTAELPCEIYDKDFQCNPSTEEPTFYAEDPEPDCGTDLVQTTLRLFAEGDAVINKQLEEFGNSTEAVLMIGKTGTGKSTLTFFLAGNNSAMISYKTGPGKYSIKDCNGKIGGSGIISQTTFPELVTDLTTQTSFYDYPGFFDTRAVCIEIANAYYMLKVATSIPKTKFILVVDYPSVGGRARDDLVDLLKSVINFIPNIEKFTSNLGLVATKVSEPLEPDEEFISWIVDFLNQTKQDLPAVLQDEDLEKATFILETLLISGRIGVFRTPNDCGPLDTISLMQTNRRNLYEMISKNLSYVATEPNDFGVSLSKDALLAITQLRESIAKDLKKALEQLSNEVLVTTETQFECQGSTNCDILVQNLQNLYKDQYFNDGYSNESLYCNISTTSILTNVSAIFLELLNNETSQNISDSLKTFGTHLEFLQTLDDIPTDIFSLMAPLSKLKNEITSLIESKFKGDVSNIIVSSMNETCLRVLENALNSFNSSGDIFAKELEIGVYFSLVTSKKEFLRNELQNSVTIYNFTSMAVNTLMDLGSTNLDEGIKAIRAQMPLLDLLETAGVETTIKLSEQQYWLGPFTSLFSLTENEQFWCNFLTNLFKSLSEKAYQIDDKKYKTWWTLNHPIPPLLDDNNDKVKLFWDYFSSIPAVASLSISKALEILQNDSYTKIRSLNVLLDSTLLPNLACTSSSGVCDCRGTYVSLAEVQSYCKPKSPKQIIVSAYHSLYLDTKIIGLEYTSANLDIILVAPLALSFSSYSFNLNGANGGTLENIPGRGTAEGKAGLPGGKSGNLYALIKSEPSELSVSVDGGKGGNGQEGQRGVDGDNGHVKELFWGNGLGANWINLDDCSAWEDDDVRLAKKYDPYTCGSYRNAECHAGDKGVMVSIQGTSGTPGKGGGNGGKAGLGGYGGRIEIPFRTRNSNSNITLKQKQVNGSKHFRQGDRSVIVGKDGSNGETGPGGLGGAGGKRGDTFNVIIDNWYASWEYRCYYMGYHHIEPSNVRESDGASGFKGGSSLAQSTPSPQTFNPGAVVPNIISNFMKSSNVLKTNEFFKSKITAFHSELSDIRIA